MLADKGSLNAMAAGAFHAIACGARALDPAAPAPVVVVVTDHSRVTLSQNQGQTLALSIPA